MEDCRVGGSKLQIKTKREIKSRWKELERLKIDKVARGETMIVR